MRVQPTARSCLLHPHRQTEAAELHVNARQSFGVGVRPVQLARVLGIQRESAQNSALEASHRARVYPQVAAPCAIGIPDMGARLHPDPGRFVARVRIGRLEQEILRCGWFWLG